MLGARGANHRENTELITALLDDSTHPLNQVFNRKPFEYRDEFFRFHDVYSRDKLRVLLSVDTNKLDLSPNISYGNTIRKDHDYALAWVRSYGRGRVFYSTIAHNPYVFYDALMLKFYLGAIQFALGDLEAPTTPSAKLSDFVVGLEKMNWSVGVLGEPSENFSIEDVAERASSNGVLQVCVPYGSKIFRKSDSKFNYGLSNLEKERFRLMLDEYGIRLTACWLNRTPNGRDETRKLYEFLSIMGVEQIIVEEDDENAVELAPLAESFDIKIAFYCNDARKVVGMRDFNKFNKNIGFLLRAEQVVLKEVSERVGWARGRIFGVFVSYKSGRDTMFGVVDVLQKCGISGTYFWVKNEEGHVQDRLKDVKDSVKSAVLSR